MDPQPLPDGNGGPPTLAHAGVTKAVCTKCYWTTTWEIGQDATTMCAVCGHVMFITAATGETIAQAIQAAAQELPDRVEPKQQVLPGTKPEFRRDAAYDSLMKKWHQWFEEEQAAESIGEKYRARKKYANAVRQQFDAMAEDFYRREQEWYRKESADERDAPAGTDATSDTPAPPPLSAGHDDARAGEGVEDQRGDAEPDRTGADDGRTNTDARPELAAGPGTGVTLTGRAHVINATLDGCVVCGIGFTPYPEHQAGDPFGMNCTGYPEDSPEWLQERLADAGADQVTLDAIALWTPEQRCTARLWALDSIEAHEQDEPGKRTSIAWPEHVSLAHHGPEYGTHTLKKRKKTTRRRSR